MTTTSTPVDVLRDVFGFASFRPGQEAAIDRLLAGRSVLAVFPTGAGKSLCYQVPALLLPGVTVVISPLIALMKDQVDALRRKGVAAARLDSTLGSSEVAAIYEQLEAGALRLLYVAPERLANERFVNRLRQLEISVLAIDEAHCISEWGHNFRPDYLKIARTAKDLRVGRVLALTATATPAVAADIRRAFAIEPDDHVQTGFYRANLDLNVTACTPAERLPLLLARLQEIPGPTIVYVTLQRTAEEVAAFLTRNGVSAAAYHAGLEPEQRTLVQESFMSAALRVVVATIAFGMGIDKADIRAIYHFNVPKTLENYAQEIGRAGRDGLPALCDVLACGDDRTALENFTYGDTPAHDGLAGLVRFLLGAGETFDVSVHDLSAEHDIRPLVVNTALTYLELEGTLHHVAPFYTEYKLKLVRAPSEICASFDAERAAFLEKVFASAKEGRIWRTLDPSRTARDLGQPRERIVAALDHLEERGDLVIDAKGLRHGYRRTGHAASVDQLTAYLHDLFQKREERDVARVESVMRYLARSECLVRGLLEYFGEPSSTACGHCVSCRVPGGRMIASSPPRALNESDAVTLDKLRAEAHSALRHPRAMTRFLCGLPSPAASRARLGRAPPFGCWSEVPFSRVLEFVSSQQRGFHGARLR